MKLSSKRLGLILKNPSCPRCFVRSEGERRIKNYLSKLNIDFKQEVAFKDLKGVGGSLLRYDFILFDDDQPYRVIEFDGIQHDMPVFGENAFCRTQIHDALKNQYALSHNIPLVRIPYSKRDTMTYDDIFGDKYLIKGDN